MIDFCLKCFFLLHAKYKFSISSSLDFCILQSQKNKIWKIQKLNVKIFLERRMREFYLKLSAPSRYPPPKIQITRVESKNVRYKKDILSFLFFLSLLFFLFQTLYFFKLKKLYSIYFFLMFLAVQSYKQKQIVCTFN